MTAIMTVITNPWIPADDGSKSSDLWYTAMKLRGLRFQNFVIDFIHSPAFEECQKNLSQKEIQGTLRFVFNNEHLYGRETI